MSARHKLNQAAMNGIVLVAGVIGVGAGSWGVFFMALGLFIVLAVHSGSIRLNSRR